MTKALRSDGGAEREEIISSIKRSNIPKSAVEQMNERSFVNLLGRRSKYLVRIRQKGGGLQSSAPENLNV